MRASVVDDAHCELPEAEGKNSHGATWMGLAMDGV